MKISISHQVSVFVDWSGKPASNPWASFPVAAKDCASFVWGDEFALESGTMCLGVIPDTVEVGSCLGSCLWCPHLIVPRAHLHLQATWADSRFFWALHGASKGKWSRTGNCPLSRVWSCRQLCFTPRSNFMLLLYSVSCYLLLGDSEKASMGPRMLFCTMDLPSDPTTNPSVGFV